MQVESQCSGGWAEQQALQQLQAQGWRLLDRNWHCRWGELDLVMERQQQVFVVEVKGRRTGCRDRHGLDAFHPAERFDGLMLKGCAVAQLTHGFLRTSRPQAFRSALVAG